MKHAYCVFFFYYRQPIVNEVYVAYAFLAVSLLGFLHYTISVVQELCGYLNIKALTIPPPIKSI